MTPKEKAYDLVTQKMIPALPINSSELNLIIAKKCALIAVYETLAVLKEMPVTVSTKFYIQFCQQVNKEINNL